MLRPFMEATLPGDHARVAVLLLARRPFNSVDQILLAGGCAQIAGIDELVDGAHRHRRRRSPTRSASMSLASRIKPQMLSADAPSLMVSLRSGAAGVRLMTTRINLLAVARHAPQGAGPAAPVDRRRRAGF
ncbi:MAG: pilus assembly protein PilM [Chromatiales bacterium]|nr:pilus assembly protein PilM [Chromatiales bacterium]